MITNRSMPSCTVVPVVSYPDIGAAIYWLCDSDRALMERPGVTDRRRADQ
jgi:hypothetical protein